MVDAGERAGDAGASQPKSSIELSFTRSSSGIDNESVSALHMDGTPFPDADEVHGKAIQRLTHQKYEKYPELVHSDRVHYVVLACEEGGRWGPDVFTVVKNLVDLKVAPLHSLLRRSAALAYTRKWWAILATGAQSAAIDCILGQDPQVWVPRGAPPLAVDLAWADVAPEPSRLG